MGCHLEWLCRLKVHSPFTPQQLGSEYRSSSRLLVEPELLEHMDEGDQLQIRRCVQIVNQNNRIRYNARVLVKRRTGWGL